MIHFKLIFLMFNISSCVQQADLARKDRLARSLSLPKLKFPFPNMVGICVQESTIGRLQLLSQCTGEILLDSCVDYWNGSDLCPLTVADRLGEIYFGT